MTILRDALVAECKRLEDYSRWNAASHFTASTWLGRAHLALGPLPAILGALGTWSGLKLIPDQAKAALLASIASLVAGIVGSIVAFWNLSEGRVKHFTAGAAYKRLENEARRATSLFPDETDEAFRDRVVELTGRYDKLGEQSAQSSDFAFWLAARKIRTGKYDPDDPARAQARGSAV